MRLFLIYVIAELAVVVALVSTIGFGWTVLVLLGTFVLGLALAGSQVKRHVHRLRAGLNGTEPPLGTATDSLLVALGTVLVVIPGLASTVLGALLLLPPGRATVRPVVTALAARRMPVITVVANGYRQARGNHRGDYIDGEVVDVIDVDQPRLPRPTDSP